MQKLPLFLIVLVMFCSPKEHPYQSAELKRAKEEAENRVKNNVHKETKYMLLFDEKNKLLFKRIDRIYFYNRLGFCFLEVIPQYQSNLSAANSIADIMSQLSETNIPKGYNDSIWYSYYNYFQVSEERRILSGGLYKVVFTYDYDTYGNKVKTCSIKQFEENTCQYTRYDYGKNGRVLRRFDSSNSVKSSFIYSGISNDYIYDESGNVIYDGYFHYNYNSQGKIVHQYTDRQDLESSNCFLQYDEKLNPVATYY